jgi:hypothetical protein
MPLTFSNIPLVLCHPKKLLLMVKYQSDVIYYEITIRSDKNPAKRVGLVQSGPHLHFIGN